MATFGNTDALTNYTEDYVEQNYALAERFTTPADFTTAEKMSVGCRQDSGGLYIKAVIWADSSGNPGALVSNGVSNAAAPATGSAGAETYLDCTFATPPTLTPSTAYWIGFVASGHVYFYIKDGTNTPQYETDNSYTTPAAISGGSSVGSNKTIAWNVTYTPSGGAATPLTANLSDSLIYG